MKQTPEEALLTLQQTTQTLFLSTLTNEGKPNASYAPFIIDNDNCFYIFVSQLASHTQDLLHSSLVSILLAEDEQDSRQIFARKRASYSCESQVIERSDEHYESLLDQFEERFGNVMGLLRTLPDFVLFKLVPTSGSFVQGFGKAYEIKKDGLVHNDPSKN